MQMRLNVILGVFVIAASAFPGAASAQPAPTPPPPTGISDGRTYTVDQVESGDRTPNGRGSWTLIVNQIDGGDGAVTAAFNRAVQNSAQGQLDSARADADPDATWTFDTDPTIHFGGASVSEVIGGLFNAVPSAHPVSFVSTVVIDSRNARPILLSDLFVDEQAGLDRLSEQTKLLLPGVMGTGRGPMADEPGNAPVAANFANWIPTPGGLEIHFNDYQFVHGTPVLTVPWSALDDVLNPDMRPLRQP
jgi:hypothetical protein